MGTVGEGLEDNARTSLGDEREAMERGQEIERLIGPESVGEAEGAGLVFSDLIGGFQCMRPVEKQNKGSGKGEKHSLTVILQFLFFPDPVSVPQSLSSSPLCFPSTAGWFWR